MLLQHLRQCACLLLLGAFCLPIQAQISSDGFSACDDVKSSPALITSLCKVIDVPLAYGSDKARNEAKIKLFVRKFPAQKKAEGTVVLIAGGPGESGASFYSQLQTMRRAFPNFDIVVPDHRGTGFSTRLCEAEESMNSEGGARLVGAEWGTCFAQISQNSERTKQFSISNAAYDLSIIIDGIHKSRPKNPIYIYGVSYGTQLVLRLFQVSSPPVKGIILDSLVPLQTDQRWDLTRRSFVVDNIGRKVLQQCDASEKCHQMMGEDAEKVLGQLLRDAVERPELLNAIPKKNLKQFLARLLDFPQLRERLPYLIKDLSNSSDLELRETFTKMEKAYSFFGDFPQLAPSIPLVSIINSSENNLRPYLKQSDLDLEEENLLFSDPIPSLMIESGLPKYSKDRFYGEVPKKFPPMLVLVGDMDPKTHIEGAVAHIEALRKYGQVQLITVDQAPHGVALFAPDCFSSQVRAFISAGRVSDRRCTLH